MVKKYNVKKTTFNPGDVCKVKTAIHVMIVSYEDGHGYTLCKYNGVYIPMRAKHLKKVKTKTKRTTRYQSARAAKRRLRKPKYRMAYCVMTAKNRNLKPNKYVNH